MTRWDTLSTYCILYDLCEFWLCQCYVTLMKRSDGYGPPPKATPTYQWEGCPVKGRLYHMPELLDR